MDALIAKLQQTTAELSDLSLRLQNSQTDEDTNSILAEMARVKSTARLTEAEIEARRAALKAASTKTSVEKIGSSDSDEELNQEIERLKKERAAKKDAKAKALEEARIKAAQEADAKEKERAAKEAEAEREKEARISSSKQSEEETSRFKALQQGPIPTPSFTEIPEPQPSPIVTMYSNPPKGVFEQTAEHLSAPTSPIIEFANEVVHERFDMTDGLTILEERRFSLQEYEASGVTAFLSLMKLTRSLTFPKEYQPYIHRLFFAHLDKDFGDDTSPTCGYVFLRNKLYDFRPSAINAYLRRSFECHWDFPTDKHADTSKIAMLLTGGQVASSSPPISKLTQFYTILNKFCASNWNATTSGAQLHSQSLHIIYRLSIGIQVDLGLIIFRKLASYGLMSLAALSKASLPYPFLIASMLTNQDFPWKEEDSPVIVVKPFVFTSSFKATHPKDLPWKKLCSSVLPSSNIPKTKTKTPSKKRPSRAKQVHLEVNVSDSASSTDISSSEDDMYFTKPRALSNDLDLVLRSISSLHGLVMHMKRKLRKSTRRGGENEDGRAGQSELGSVISSLKGALSLAERYQAEAAQAKTSRDKGERPMSKREAEKELVSERRKKMRKEQELVRNKDGVFEGVNEVRTAEKEKGAGSSKDVKKGPTAEKAKGVGSSKGVDKEPTVTNIGSSKHVEQPKSPAKTTTSKQTSQGSGKGPMALKHYDEMFKRKQGGRVKQIAKKPARSSKLHLRDEEEEEELEAGGRVQLSDDTTDLSDEEEL